MLERIMLGALLPLVVLAPSLHAAQTPEIKASFTLNGTEAKLTQVRAVRTVLDDGRTKKPGFVVLLSEKPASPSGGQILFLARLYHPEDSEERTLPYPRPFSCRTAARCRNLSELRTT